MMPRVCPACKRAIPEGERYQVCPDPSCRRNYHLGHRCPLHPHAAMVVVQPQQQPEPAGVSAPSPRPAARPAARLSGRAAALAASAALLALVALGVLRLPAAAPTLAPTATALRVPATATAPIAYPTATPTPLPSPLPTSRATAPTPAAQPTALVVGNTGCDGAYLRRSVERGEQIRAWSDGTELVVVGPDRQSGGRTWRNVRDPDGNVGWIPADYLVPTTSPPRPLATLAVGNTNAEGAYIRCASDLNRKLRAWRDGTRMVVVGPDRQIGGRTWRYVRDPDGNIGLVLAEYLVRPGS